MFVLEHKVYNDRPYSAQNNMVNSILSQFFGVE